MWIAFGVGIIIGASLGVLIFGLVCAGRDFYDNDGEF